MTPTLCAPDREKSCFACCPPIRPAHYEHIQYRNIIRRELLENTDLFDAEDRRARPITGFSCWALGYLDRECKRVGCLLHPMRNGGLDLRYRVDYGDKCGRETCPEAQVFSSMDLQSRGFWLRLSEGLDSFAYSSRKHNPLFTMMGWGASLLGAIAAHEGYRGMPREPFFRRYPVFTLDIQPRAHAYLLKRLAREEGIDRLRSKGFKNRFQTFSAGAFGGMPPARPSADGEAVHRLDLDPDFLDLLRLGLGIRRIDPSEAIKQKEAVDDMLEFVWKTGSFP